MFVVFKIESKIIQKNVCCYLKIKTMLFSIDSSFFGIIYEVLIS